MKRIVLIVATAVALVGAVAPAAHADRLPFYEPRAACSYWPSDSNRMIVHPPFMTPLGNLAIVNGTLIPNPLQQVGYRVTIYRQDDWNSSLWRPYSGTPLMTRTADGSSTDGWWWNTLTKRWDYPISFPIARAGHYAVRYDLYWYANQYFGSASASGWVQNIEGSEDPICDY
jgi:hypothetical protein